MIDIQDPQKSIACSRFLPLLKGVARACGLDGSLTIRIGTDEESHELNRRHRHKNKPTDVLSFPEEILPGMRHPYHGDRPQSLEAAILMLADQVEAASKSLANPTDEEIRAIADTGGVIGIIAMSYFQTKPEKRDCVDVIVKIVEHMVDKGGEDVVAFGSDFDGFTGPPRDFKSPRDYKRIRDALLRRFSEAQVAKFLSENVLRALKTGWDAPARAAEKAAEPAAAG